MKNRKNKRERRHTEAYQILVHKDVEKQTKSWQKKKEEKRRKVKQQSTKCYTET